MPTMKPYPISGTFPLPEKMFSETFRWITNHVVKDWVIFHAFEVSDSRTIDFVMLDKTYLSVICLEVVSEQTDLVDSLGDPIAPISISEEAMDALRKQFSHHFSPDSRLALGHAIVFPNETQYEVGELPDHLKQTFSTDVRLPKFTLCTGSYTTCDPLDPYELGITLEEYARDELHLPNSHKIKSKRDWEKGQLEWNNLRNEFEAKYDIGTTFMRPTTIFSTNLDTLNQELLRLTIEQYTSLDRTENNPRCVIAGAAGTGKTVLAMELAKRRAQKHTETVALMCSNANLSRRFKKWATGISEDVGGKIVAGTPATLPLSVFEDNDVLKDEYTKMLKNSKLEETLRLGAIDNGWYHFIRKAVNDLRENDLSNYFDYLIVDEAQNLFDPVFLNLMDQLLKGGMDNGYWTMFGDLKQAIVTLDRKLEWEKVLVDFGIDYKWSYDELQTNCRNTHEIATAVSSLSRVESTSMSGVHGPDVQIEYFKGQEQFENKLDGLISNWKSEGLNSRQIILLSSTVVTEFGANQPNYGGWKLCNISDIPEVDRGNITEHSDSSGILGYSDTPLDILRYSDVYDFQGLESDLVILIISCTDDQVSIEGTVLLEDEKHLNRVLYIGMSRAKTMLIVLADKRYEEHLIAREKKWKEKKTHPQNSGKT